MTWCRCRFQPLDLSTGPVSDDLTPVGDPVIVLVVPVHKQENRRRGAILPRVGQRPRRGFSAFGRRWGTTGRTDEAAQDQPTETLPEPPHHPNLTLTDPQR